jgi:hypothetical protein
MSSLRMAEEGAGHSWPPFLGLSASWTLVEFSEGTLLLANTEVTRGVEPAPLCTA